MGFGALTKDRMRFPNTYIGIHESQHAVWSAPRTSRVRLMPAERTSPLAKNVVPYEIIAAAKWLRDSRWNALLPCVSIR